ncbi:MAG: hypothetical protein KGQ66_11835 [Acidobacteriota bacterium]|nr:hypothetical protein [Acidobacteriota bacterium]
MNRRDSLLIIAAIAVFATIVGWDAAVYQEPLGTVHRVVGSPARGAGQAAVILLGGLMIYGVARFLVHKKWV